MRLSKRPGAFRTSGCLQPMGSGASLNPSHVPHNPTISLISRNGAVGAHPRVFLYRSTPTITTISICQYREAASFFFILDFKASVKSFRKYRRFPFLEDEDRSFRPLRRTPCRWGLQLRLGQDKSTRCWICTQPFSRLEPRGRSASTPLWSGYAHVLICLLFQEFSMQALS
jgi:hypothetical protein